MIGRREFGMLGVSAAAAAFSGSLRAADDRPRQDAHSDDAHADVMDACAEACSDCQRACDACATHCAMMVTEGKQEHAVTLATCLDCADYCAAASRITARKGPFAGLICESCAVACDRCAKECEKFPMDKHMTACAEECRKCEKACKSMLPHVGHAAG
jgi:hypothetical protein